MLESIHALFFRIQNVGQSTLKVVNNDIHCLITCLRDETDIILHCVYSLWHDKSVPGEKSLGVCGAFLVAFRSCACSDTRVTQYSLEAGLASSEFHCSSVFSCNIQSFPEFFHVTELPVGYSEEIRLVLMLNHFLCFGK